jgi:hypothetical protein
MQDSDIRYLNMGRRVTAFNDRNNPAFPPGSRGSELRVIISADVREGSRP